MCVFYIHYKSLNVSFIFPQIFDINICCQTHKNLIKEKVHSYLTTTTKLNSRVIIFIEYVCHSY